MAVIAIFILPKAQNKNNIDIIFIIICLQSKAVPTQNVKLTALKSTCCMCDYNYTGLQEQRHSF